MPRCCSRLLVAALFCALLAILLRLAWLSDDAFITLRTVENWVQGHGLVWNVGERVQTYTHPLWMFLLAAVRALTGEAFYGTIFLGITVTLLAVLVLMRIAGTASAAGMVLCVAIASRSFTDFATGGLENPASSLLLAALVAIVTGATSGTNRLLSIVLVSALAATNRFDLGLLCAPTALAALRGIPWSRAGQLVLLGGSPLLAWLLFATFYYGSPFPITAYGKAFAVDLPAGVLFEQGLRHLWYVCSHDPVTPLTIITAMVLGLLRRELRCRWLALGMLLYSAYVLRVGGDFMAGRFYTPQFVIAVAILARWGRDRSEAHAWTLAAIALGLLFLPGLPQFLRPPAADTREPSGYHGIVDERRFYYVTNGLFGAERGPCNPGVLTAGLRASGNRDRPIIAPWGQVGRYGYDAGELVHIVDSWLLDPLLMRLPLGNPEVWRIGHFVRRIPEGYLETLAFGGNRIHHPGLARYYDTLRLAIRGPLTDGNRLAAVGRLLTGADADGLRAFVAEQYRTPPRLRIPLAELANPPPVGTFWFDDPRIRLIYHGGVQIDCGAPVSARSLLLHLQPERRYTLRLRLGERELAAVTADFTATPRFAGLRTLTVDVPPAAAGFDNLWVDAEMNSEQVPAIAGVQPRS
ncbi:MAG: hypothetical protein IPK26_12860 [Planctomycetes bacterium]|nr:hypothetical protein [Planctomycetota bacterium]